MEKIEQKRRECKQPSLQQLISSLKPCKIFDKEEYKYYSHEERTIKNRTNGAQVITASIIAVGFWLGTERH